MSKKILVAVDISDKAMTEKVIGAAVDQWQQNPDARLILITVVPDLVAGLDWRYAIRGETGGSEEFDMHKVVNSALERLNAIGEELVPDGMEVETIARHGAAYEQVLEVAEELAVDQIIVGAQRDNAADFLLGSNTARIVRHARCSVTVVRE